MRRPTRTSGSCTAPRKVMMPAQRQQHSPGGHDHLEHGLAVHSHCAGARRSARTGGSVTFGGIRYLKSPPPAGGRSGSRPPGGWSPSEAGPGAPAAASARGGTRGMRVGGAADEGTRAGSRGERSCAAAGAHQSSSAPALQASASPWTHESQSHLPAVPEQDLVNEEWPIRPRPWVVTTPPAARPRSAGLRVW